MKDKKDTEGLPEGMTDIKSGQIFEVPQDYFENLPDQIFYRYINVSPTKTARYNIKRLRYWMVAASIALILSVIWWYFPDNPPLVKNLVIDSELNEYIELEIMDYDLESLTGHLREEDLFSLMEDDHDAYQKYIEDHIESFDEIIY